MQMSQKAHDISDWRIGNFSRSHQSQLPEDAQLVELFLTPDGPALVIGYTSGTIEVYNIKSYTCMPIFNFQFLCGRRHPSSHLIAFH
jgi:hypothetical protein